MEGSLYPEDIQSSPNLLPVAVIRSILLDSPFFHLSCAAHFIARATFSGSYLPLKLVSYLCLWFMYYPKENRSFFFLSLFFLLLIILIHKRSSLGKDAAMTCFPSHFILTPEFNVTLSLSLKVFSCFLLY